MEPSEGQPILQNGPNPITVLKEKRDKAKAQIIAKANKDQKRFECIMKLGMVCLLGIFAFFIFLIVRYFVNGFEARDKVDTNEVAIHEQWIDYLAPDVVAPEWPYTCLLYTSDAADE